MQPCKFIVFVFGVHRRSQSEWGNTYYGPGCICLSVGALGFSCSRRSTCVDWLCPLAVGASIVAAFVLRACLSVDHWFSRDCRWQLCLLALPSRRLCCHCGCACFTPLLFCGSSGFLVHAWYNWLCPLTACAAIVSVLVSCPL